jgi:hypothetical protein
MLSTFLLLQPPMVSTLEPFLFVKTFEELTDFTKYVYY